MIETKNVAGEDEGKNKEVARTTEQPKTGRKWVRRVLWGIAIVAAGLLISGTMAAILWCN